MSNYHELVGIAKALGEIRGELEQAKPRQELVDIGNVLTEVRDELADVAAAVRELADAVRTQQEPRRRWFSRPEYRAKEGS